MTGRFKQPELTVLGAQRKLDEQHGVSVHRDLIGVGDFNEGRNAWPVYASVGSTQAPSLFWIERKTHEQS